MASDMGEFKIEDRLKKYGFRDKHGHPLENCIEYHALLAASADPLTWDRVLTLLEGLFFGGLVDLTDVPIERLVALVTRVKEAKLGNSVRPDTAEVVRQALLNDLGPNSMVYSIVEELLERRKG